MVRTQKKNKIKLEIGIKMPWMVRTPKKKIRYWSKNTLDGEDILQKKKKRLS